MIKKHFLFLLFVVAAGPLFAQSATLRTSEHENFTRVVVRLPETVPWSMEKIETGYRLDLDGQVQFPNPEILDGVSKQRIFNATVDSSLSQISFQMECDCTVDAYMLVSNWLVLDFFDAVTSIKPSLQASDLKLPLLRVIPERPLLSSLGQKAPSIDAPRLRELENALSDSLERALAQGLVEKALGASDETDGHSNSIDNLGLEVTLPSLDEMDIPGFTTRTSIGDSATRPIQTIDATGQELRCQENEAINILSWSTEDSFTDQLGVLRGRIVGEFDKVDSAAVEDLAKLYLHFGLGREAKRALSIDALKSSHRNVLVSIAEILDDDPLTDESFVAQHLCKSEVGFWGFMAINGVDQNVSVDAQLLSRAFKSLPYHLQVLLGPRFAERLRRMGAVEAARFVLEPVQKSDPYNLEARVESSRISLAEGDEDDAVLKMDQIVQSDFRMTPETLFQLIRLKIERDEVVEDDLLALLHSMAFEFSAVMEMSEFAEMEIRTLVHQKNLKLALNELEEPDNGLELPLIEDLKNLVAVSVLALEDDLQFLDFAYSLDDFSMDTSLENKFAKRLAGLDFPEKALGRISGPAIGNDLSERRYLRAEIAIKQGDADAAAAALSGVDTTRAIEIMASNQAEENFDQEPLNEQPQPEDSLTLAASSKPLAAASLLIEESEMFRDQYSSTLEELPTLID